MSRLACQMMCQRGHVCGSGRQQYMGLGFKLGNTMEASLSTTNSGKAARPLIAAWRPRRHKLDVGSVTSTARRAFHYGQFLRVVRKRGNGCKKRSLQAVQGYWSSGCVILSVIGAMCRFCLLCYHLLTQHIEASLSDGYYVVLSDCKCTKYIIVTARPPTFPLLLYPFVAHLHVYDT